MDWGWGLTLEGGLGVGLDSGGGLGVGLDGSSVILCLLSLKIASYF